MAARQHGTAEQREVWAQELIWRPIEINDSAVVGGMSAGEQKAWMDRSQKWPGLPPSQWRAQKVLGRGGNGTCGLWKYRGKSAHFPPYIVVKQAPGRYSLRKESKWLRLLANQDPKSEHIPKLYRGTHWEGGSGTNPLLDPSPFPLYNGLIMPVFHPRALVSRLYMEYFSGGDLVDALSSRVYTYKSVPEEYVWRLIECLASAMLMLETGNEKLRPSATWRPWNHPIVHLDIKSDNIFIGDRGKTHPRMGRFILGDFGLALEVPSPNHQHFQDYIDQAACSGTTVWMAPEQLDNPPGDIGIKTNIWGLGAVCHHVIVGSHLQDDNTDPNTGQIWVLQDDRDFVVPLFENVTGPRRLQPFEAFGSMFHHAALRRNYSEQLIELVHRCLAVNPQDRPTARSILRLAKETVELFRNLSGPNNEPADFKDGGGSKVLNMVKAKLPGKLKKYAGHQFPQQPQSWVAIHPPARAWNNHTTPEDRNNELLFADNILSLHQTTYDKWPWPRPWQPPPAPAQGPALVPNPALGLAVPAPAPRAQRNRFRPKRFDEIRFF